MCKHFNIAEHTVIIRIFYYFILHIHVLLQFSIKNWMFSSCNLCYANFVTRYIFLLFLSKEWWHKWSLWKKCHNNHFRIFAMTIRYSGEMFIFLEIVLSLCVTYYQLFITFMLWLYISLNKLAQIWYLYQIIRLMDKTNTSYSRA